MTSNIDAAVPADNVKVDKALLRANNAAAKTEIEQLQADIGIPGQLAFGTLSFN